MKKHIILITLLISGATFSQVGINTEEPKATLEVAASPLDDTKIDGVIAPRLTRSELTNKGNSLYGAEQEGAILYITDVSGGNADSQRVNITEPGYFYFDGAVWQKFAFGTGTEDADPTVDAWIDDPANSMVLLGTESDGVSPRDSLAEVVVTDGGRIGIGTKTPAGSLAITKSGGTSSSAIHIEQYKTSGFTGSRGLTGISGGFNYSNGDQGAWGIAAADGNGSAGISDGLRIQLRETPGATSSWHVGFLLNKNGAVSLGANQNGNNPTLYLSDKLTKNVGIGTTQPSHKLHIVNNGPAFQLQDGSQAANYMLVSDANGVATWKPQPTAPPTLVAGGTSGSGVNIPFGVQLSSQWYHTGGSITLPPGLWKIDLSHLLIGATQGTNSTSYSLPADEYAYVRFTLIETAPGTIGSAVTANPTPDFAKIQANGSATTGFNQYVGTNFSGPVKAGGRTNVTTAGPRKYIVASGSMSLKNSTTSPKTYYIAVQTYRATSNISMDDFQFMNVGSSANGENTIIASPLFN